MYQDSWQDVLGLMVRSLGLMIRCIRDHGITYLEVWDNVLDVRYDILEFLAV